MPTDQALRDLADELRRVLVAVHEGQLSASTGRDKRIIAQLEGAVAAVEALIGQSEGNDAG